MKRIKVYIDGTLTDGFKTDQTYSQGERLGLEVIRKGKIEKVNFMVHCIEEDSENIKIIGISY